MQFSNKLSRLFSLILWLIAFHSFIVGCALTFSPSFLMEYFGYLEESEPFFRMQGGVFHIILSVVYAWAATDPVKNKPMVMITILAKVCATAFLIGYFIFIGRIWMVLVSGLIDFIMAVIVWRFQVIVKAALIKDKELSEAENNHTESNSETG